MYVVIVVTTLEGSRLGTAPDCNASETPGSDADLHVPRIAPEDPSEFVSRHRSPGPLPKFLLRARDELGSEPEVHLSLPVGRVDRAFRALDLHARESIATTVAIASRPRVEA